MMHKRFHGKIGEEFNLSESIIPHRKEMQEYICSTIRKEFKDKAVKKINVLEVGCGTGFTTHIILKSDTRVVVTAVDNEIKMIEQAQIALTSFIEQKKVELVHEDALTFLEKQASQSYDVFSSSETLHNFDQEYRQKVLKEIYRVLKKEGLFINVDKYAAADKTQHKRALDWQLQEFKTKLLPLGRQDLVDVWTEHYLEDEQPEKIMEETASIEFMKSLGFKNIQILSRKHLEAVLFAKKE